MNSFFRSEVLIFCLILAVFALITTLPFYQIKISKLLADLTQSLIIKEVNPVRTSYGLSQLRPSEKLAEAASLKAQDMITRNYFSHSGPEGEAPWVWLDRVGYKYAAAGENLAMDINDPVVLRDAWLASPSHAKNILNDYFTDIGIGVAHGKIGDKNTIVVVMFLGREMEESEEILATEEKTIKEVPSQEIAIISRVEEDRVVSSAPDKITEPANPVYYPSFFKFLADLLTRGLGFVKK